jgi:copper chaperone CopZ
VQVDFATKKAVVTFDSKGNDGKSLIESLKEAGFGGEVVK